MIQTLEALHATREGIIEDAAMADLASVLGWSYPAHRGGVMSYIDFIGRAEFERVRAGLQRKFGDRFALPGSSGSQILTYAKRSQPWRPFPEKKVSA